ncbi:MAG: OmpA family protein [Pseudomonadota bacterium]
MTKLTMNSHGGMPPHSAAFVPPQPKPPVLLYVGVGVLFLAMFTALVVTTTLLVVQSRDRAAPQMAAAVVAPVPEPVIAAEPSEVTRTSVNLLDTDLDAQAPAPAPDPKPVLAAVAPTTSIRLNERYKQPSCIDYLDTMVKITQVRFPLGSNEPHESDMPRVRNIATALAMCPEVKVVVEGHSDRRGSDKLNMDLSLYRAETVIEKLQGEGFDIAGLEPLGFGARRPINLSGTISGEGENRRVQFQLVPADVQVDQLARN